MEVQDEEEDKIETSVSQGQIYAKTDILETLKQAWTVLSAYGWYIIIAIVIVLFCWVKLKPYYYTWRRKYAERSEMDNFDPVKAERMQDALVRNRERLQRHQDEKTEEFLRKKTQVFPTSPCLRRVTTVDDEHQLEREEAERDERIKQWETFGVVTKSKHSKDKGTSSSYLPLSGGSSFGVKFSRKTGPRGGGGG